MKIKLLERKTNFGLLILRVSVGFMMLLHGIAKMSKGLGGIKNILHSQGFPEFFAYGVLAGEVLAPILIIIGFRTRLSSAVLAFNCITAYFLVHRNNLFTLNSTGGWAIETLGLFFFGALTLIFTGGGKYSTSTKSMWD